MPKLLSSQRFQYSSRTPSVVSLKFAKSIRYQRKGLSAREAGGSSSGFVPAFLMIVLLFKAAVARSAGSLIVAALLLGFPLRSTPGYTLTPAPQADSCSALQGQDTIATSRKRAHIQAQSQKRQLLKRRRLDLALKFPRLWEFVVFYDCIRLPCARGTATL